MVLPCASVMVMVVLLNDAFTCATPDAMFLRSRRRTRPAASLPIHDPFEARAEMRKAKISSHFECLGGRLLLAGDRLGWPLAGAGVGMGALATDRGAPAGGAGRDSSPDPSTA